jgi:2-dehydro-3-deoxyglucarate aldolase
MQLEQVRKAMKEKTMTIGSWLMFDHPLMTELIVKSGVFDWLVVDMEHGGADFSSMAQQIQIIDLAGCTPIVRVGFNDPYQIKRALDAGAGGIIVPMTMDADDAKRAVDSIYYPPRGSRGVGLFRAQDYGGDFEGYKKRVDDGLIFIPQIEHHKSVSDLENILDVDGVDGFIVGPYDLSGSLGMPGQFDHPDVIAQMDRLERIMKDNPKPGGFHVVHPDHDEFKRRVDQGARLLAYGIDMEFLRVMLEREAPFLKSIRSDVS